MPGELDPMNSSDSVREKYEKLISENTQDIVPLNPQTQKIDNVEHKTLGGNEIATKVLTIARIKIAAQSAQSAQPKPSFFKEILTSAYNYIKQKLTFKKSVNDSRTPVNVSRPMNVKVATPEEKMSLLKNHLKMANKQLAALDHNLKHPGEKQLQLDPNYPKALIPLKELIKDLGKVIDSNKNNYQSLVDEFEENSTEKHPLDQFSEEVQALRQDIAINRAILNSPVPTQEDLESQINIIKSKLETLRKSGDSSPRLMDKLEKAIDQRMAQKIALLNISTSTEELAEMRKKREGELESFDQAINQTENDIDAINQELETIEAELNNLDWTEGVQTLHDYQGLIEQKATLEQNLANDRVVQRDLLDELGILNAKSSPPSHRELKEVDEDRPLEVLTGEEWEWDAESTAKTYAERATELELELYNLENQIESQKALVNAAWDRGDFDTAADLDLEKDDLVEERDRLRGHLDALNEAMGGHTVDIHELQERIRIQQHDLEKVHQEMDELNIRIKTPSLSRELSENMLKMREYRNQRNGLMAELKKNENELQMFYDAPVREVPKSLDLGFIAFIRNHIAKVKEEIALEKKIIEAAAGDDVDHGNKLEELEKELADATRLLKDEQS